MENIKTYLGENFVLETGQEISNDYDTSNKFSSVLFERKLWDDFEVNDDADICGELVGIYRSEVAAIKGHQKNIELFYNKKLDSDLFDLYGE